MGPEKTKRQHVPVTMATCPSKLKVSAILVSVPLSPGLGLWHVWSEWEWSEMWKRESKQVAVVVAVSNHQAEGTHPNAFFQSHTEPLDCSEHSLSHFCQNVQGHCRRSLVVSSRAQVSMLHAL